jgi:hypothetical protein
MSGFNATNSLKVAVIQHAPVFLNIEHSVAKACDLIEEAANQGAKVIAFPETWLPGYPVWLDVSPNAAVWDYAPAKALYRSPWPTGISTGCLTWPEERPRMSSSGHMSAWAAACTTR